jgi:succinate dehydrogenase/fumarate reductase flavoprotein subunit
MDEPTQTDVVIAGAGMGGLTAGVEAAERGASVTVLEKADSVGGSLALSAGLVWTHESIEQTRAEIPGGDEPLQRLVVERIDEGYQWLQDHGLELTEPPFQLRDDRKVMPPEPGVWKRMSVERFIEMATETIREHGGEIHCETPLETVERGPDGTITGVVAHDGDGLVTIDASTVILATGGFQGNEQLVQEYITERTDRLWLRSNPHSTGDGLLAALDCGGKSSEAMGTFYGHNMLSSPGAFTTDEFVDLSQYYGPRAVALDEDGQRFTDESESAFEYTLAQDTAKRADGRAVLVLDSALYASESVGPIGEEVDRARDHYDSRVAVAESLASMRETLTAWGIDGGTAIETIQSYNEHLETGASEQLNPSRERYHNTIDDPPFYLVEVQPGITFTMGGIAATSDLEVIDRAASDSGLDHPTGPERTRSIPGLYAAGVDVGNISNRGYLGGLAQSLLTGIVAGQNASSYADGR